MDFMEAVARWRVCEYGEDKCLGENKCRNYIWVDPRTWDKKGIGPGPSGQRTLCYLFDDLNEQLRESPSLDR